MGPSERKLRDDVGAAGGDVVPAVPTDVCPSHWSQGSVADFLSRSRWIVSWASLQSFVITACDSSRALRWFSPWVANSLFLGLGGGLVIVLAVRLFISSPSQLPTDLFLLQVALGYSANVSYLLFTGYKDLQVLLYAAMPVYPAPVDAATSAGVALEWSEFLERATDCLKLTRITVIEFATSAAVTALVRFSGSHFPDPSKRG